MLTVFLFVVGALVLSSLLYSMWQPDFEITAIGNDDDDYLDLLAGDDDDDEVVGAEEIIGVDEIIGKVTKNVVNAMKRARALDPNAVLVRKKKNEARRRKILPTAGVLVGIGATVTIVYSTEELFRPERFIIDELTGDDFIIEDILVGTRSMFASTGEVKASIFRPDAVDANVHFDSANVGNKIKVIVRNTNAAARTFYGSFIGTSVE